MSNAPKSVAPSMPLSCWIRNFESVVRPRCMVGTPSGRLPSRGELENPARANIRLGDRRQILGREFSILVGKQPARLAKARAIQRVARTQAGDGAVECIHPILV